MLVYLDHNEKRMLEWLDTPAHTEIYNVGNFCNTENRLTAAGELLYLLREIDGIVINANEQAQLPCEQDLS